MKPEKLSFCLFITLLIYSVFFTGANAEEITFEKLQQEGVLETKEAYVEDIHYVVLKKPVSTRDSNKVEVVEMFSYGCPHCYEFEPLIKGWSKQQDSDVDFWYFPAVWNEPMKLFARAFYASKELNVADKIHLPLFKAMVIEQKNIRNKNDLAEFLTKYGVDKEEFFRAYHSTIVKNKVEEAEKLVLSYKPAGTPEIIVNGKYRVDRMRAGGMKEMLAVVDFLVNKEREMQAR